MGYEEENLISKRALLEKYDISYGALYRWKRKGLIPEDWFIKRSTTTGQETYFPKELICERVECILWNKEEVLLDDLAQKLSGEESSRAKIILDTVFGEKSFLLQDVKSVKIIDKNGKQREISLDISEK